MKQTQKKGIHHKLKKHPWDETLVIAVIIVAVICILLLLASSMKTVGKAYAGLPSKEGVAGMLSKCRMVSGEGKTKCNIDCGRMGRTCISAWKGEELKRCRDKIKGKYSCLCCSPH